jgi:hypothetical protein
MVFNATFNNISVISWLSCFIRHMTFTFLIRVATHLVDSFWGGVVPLSREARSYFYIPGFPRFFYLKIKMC